MTATYYQAAATVAVESLERRRNVEIALGIDTEIEPNGGNDQTFGARHEFNICTDVILSSGATAQQENTQLAARPCLRDRRDDIGEGRGPGELRT